MPTASRKYSQWSTREILVSWSKYRLRCLPINEPVAQVGVDKSTPVSARIPGVLTAPINPTDEQPQLGSGCAAGCWSVIYWWSTERKAVWNITINIVSGDRESSRGRFYLPVICKLWQGLPVKYEQIGLGRNSWLINYLSFAVVQCLTGIDRSKE